MKTEVSGFRFQVSGSPVVRLSRGPAVPSTLGCSMLGARCWMFNLVRSLAVFCLLPAVLCLLAGCAGYRLGSTLPPDIRSVHIPTFINETDEPQLEMETTGAVITEFQRNGTLRITDRDQADSILEVVIKKYELVPIRYDRDEATTAKEYRLVITASINFSRVNADMPIIKNKQVIGESDFDVVGDRTTLKRQALPKVAKDLGHNIIEAVVEYW